MPALIRLVTADDALIEEVSLVNWALSAGLATQYSLAAELSMPRTTLAMILEGRRPPRPGLLHGLLRHLTPEERLDVLTEQARRWGADPGALRRRRAHQEATDQALGEVIDLLQRKRELAPVPTCLPLPLELPQRSLRRRPRRARVANRQLALLEAA